VSLESVLHTSRHTPTSRASNNSARIALYFVWLLDVLKMNYRDFSMRIWFGPSSTMTTHAPFWLEEPSIYKVHWSSSAFAAGC